MQEILKLRNSDALNGALEWRKESEIGEFSDRATAVLLYPIKDRFYGSLRSTNRPSVSLAPHPRRHMVVTHRCVSPCGSDGFYAFHNKEEKTGVSGVSKKRPRESECASENRGIATSVINGILSSLHVKLGWTSPPPPPLLFSSALRPVPFYWDS